MSAASRTFCTLKFLNHVRYLCRPCVERLLTHRHTFNALTVTHPRVSLRRRYTKGFQTKGILQQVLFSHGLTTSRLQRDGVFSRTSAYKTRNKHEVYIRTSSLHSDVNKDNIIFYGLKERNTLHSSTVCVLRCHRRVCTLCMYECMYVCMYVCVCVCICMCKYVLMYLCMYICMCMCVCIDMYVCIHVCMYVYKYVCMCVYV